MIVGRCVTKKRYMALHNVTLRYKRYIRYITFEHSVSGVTSLFFFSPTPLRQRLHGYLTAYPSLQPRSSQNVHLDGSKPAIWPLGTPETGRKHTFPRKKERKSVTSVTLCNVV